MQDSILMMMVLSIIFLSLHCKSNTNQPMQGVSLDQLPVRDKIPDPLVLESGATVDDAERWTNERAAEIKDLFSHYMYGFMPPPVNITTTVRHLDANYMDGQAIKKQVTITFGPEGTPGMHLLVVIPKNTPDPSPVILGPNFHGNHTVLPDEDIPLSEYWVPERGEGVENNRATPASRGTSSMRWDIEAAIGRGYAVATFYHGDLDPDKDDFSDGVHSYIPLDGETQRTEHSWGSLAAWAWGIHRAVDYLSYDPDIDPARIAVMGHSRNGKAALWAGATDARIALIISNQSGCGGAALSSRKKGETVKAINDRFPHWFNMAFRSFNDNEERLPMDQHMLISLLAPRPVLVASAEDDAWADPEGEFLALKGAEPVYKLLGYSGLNNESMPPTNQLVGDLLGYHIRPGGHGVGPQDWALFLDFADMHFGRNVEDRDM